MAYVTVAGNTIKANPNAKPGSITGAPASAPSGGSSGGSSREYDPSAPNIYLSQTPTTGGVRGPTTKTNYSGNIATTLSAESLGSQSTSVASIPQYPGGVTGVTGTKPGAFNEFSSAFTTPQGYTTDANGNVVPEQQTEQTDIGSLFEKYFPQKESVLQNKQVQQAQDQYDEARNRQRGFSNQIAQITNTAQAKALSTIGQGRGIPEAIIGGQQSQIYREAAIQALPIQSQLAFAQGDVEAAQEHLTRLTAVLTEEVNNRYEFQKSLGMAVINYATDVQKMQISSLLDEKKAFSTAQAETYQMLALNNATPAVWEAVRGAKNTQQLYQAAGKYGTDILGQEAQRANIEQSRAATAASNRSNQPGNGLPGEQLYSGLSSATATAVRGVATKFGTEPQIQNFSTIQDGYNFASSISDTTTNPADDQALIYSLAKALDPGSVVREGEYATAQKYAQSWINAYGKGVTQALAGTGFLSVQARQNIKTTIEQKYNSTKRSYDQLTSSYTTKIDALTGRNDGAQFLTDYVTPAAPTPPPQDDVAVFDEVVGAPSTGGYFSRLWSSILGN